MKKVRFFPPHPVLPFPAPMLQRSHEATIGPCDPSEGVG